MVDSNGSKSKFDISSINLTNTNSNDVFTKEFSFLFKSISEPEINNAIKHGDHEKYRKLIKDHNATFIASPKRSLSPLHHAVTCNNKNIDAVKETINSVLQSGIDINHPDEDGNTPLMHLLSEAAKQEKKYSKGALTGVIKLLIERGASLNEHNESECASGSDFIDELKSKKVLTQKEIDDIYKAQQDLKEKAKKELSTHVQDIEDVLIYGSCAKIQLKGNNKEEFKISEFLQSDFCKNNGISGFSTLHDNGKSGMHGVVSSEGVRHYVVTDGSYEMVLNWPAKNGVNHTIKIHINAEGSVTVDKEYLDLYKAGEIDIDANEDVKLGDLSLSQALEKGRWKEQQVHEVLDETIRNGIKEPVQKVGNHSPLSPEGNTFFERVFNEQQPVVQRQSENQQHSNQGRSKTPPPTPQRVSSLPKGQQQLENQQQPVLQQQSVDNQNELGHQINSKKAQEKRNNRQALQEENSEDRIYSLKKLFQVNNEPPQNEDVPELQLKFNQYNKGLREVNSINEPPQNEDVPEFQLRFNQGNKGLRKVNSINEPPQNEDVPELLAKLKSVNTDGMSEQTRKHLIEAGLLTDEVFTDSEQPSSPNSGNDSGFSSPTHTSHNKFQDKFQVDTQQLEERLIHIEQSSENDGTSPNIHLGETQQEQEWDSTYDFPLHDDSGFEEELEALETLSKEFEDKEKNEQIDFKTVKSNTAHSNPADQVMSELKESFNPDSRKIPQGSKLHKLLEKDAAQLKMSELKESLNPDSRKIPQGSKLHKLLEKDAAQLKIGVMEGEREDTSTKPINSFDRNRTALANKLAKHTNWVKRVTTTPTTDKDKGLPRK